MIPLNGRGEISNPRRRVRALATILTVVCLTAVSAACGQAQPARGPVALLPSIAGKGTAWDWTAACRVGPRAATGCEPSGPVLGVAQLAGNAWNLGGGTGTGSLGMTLDASGVLDVTGHLSSAPPCTDPSCVAPQANTWVRGYPSVLYGIDQCNAQTSPPQSPQLRLPMKVGSIPANLVGSATYESQTAHVTYDTAYDMWLNASGTKKPCRTNGTVEVMVWTDYNAQSLLPDSLKVGTASVPFAVNGAADPGNDSWSVYVNNVYRGGSTVPWGGTVWVVLDAAHVVKKGQVTVDLSGALSAVGRVLENNYGWSDFAGNYWLDTIAFGTEFGPQNADQYGADPIDFSLRLSSYCLEAGTTVSATAC